MAFEGQIQDVKLERHSEPIRDLIHWLKYMIAWVLLVGDAFLCKRNGFSFWISLQVCESQVIKDLPEMPPSRTSNLARGGE